MKKLLIVPLLLLAIGMLVAVESDPSNVVGYVKYDCYSGLNYVAVPLGAGGNVADLVAANMPNIRSIFKFNPLTQGWDSIDYDDEFEEWTGDMSGITGEVLLFDCLANTSFYSLGDIPTNHTYSIVPGFNYIVVPVNQGSYTAVEHIGSAIGNVSSIFVFNNLTHGWDSIDYDVEFEEWTGSMPVEIGDVILIDSLGSATWPSRAAVTSPFSTKQ